MGTHRILQPALLMLMGESPGLRIEIREGPSKIGRGAGCDLRLQSPKISRKHATIARDSTGCWIENVSLTSPTRVNGHVITERTRLKDGDTVRLGGDVFRFECPPVTVRDDDQGSEILGTRTLPDPSSWIPDAVTPDAKLDAVLEIGRELAGTLDTDELLGKVLSILFRIFPSAGRGFVLMRDESGGPRVRSIKFRDGESDYQTISRTVFDLVMAGDRAILSKDVSKEFPNVGSLAGPRVRTLMCVPLRDHDLGLIGVLQIDSRDGHRKFKVADLDLLVAVAGQVGLFVENARLHDVSIRAKILEQEGRYARQVQRALLPRRRPVVPGYAFWDYYEPASFVGGDYFDYNPVPRADDPPDSPPTLWAITIGDVAGHGMAAALVMARLSSQLHMLLRSDPDPARLVDKLNRELCEAGTADRFVTFLLVLLDIREHEATFVRAGHELPLVRRADGRVESVEDGWTGLVLGVKADVEYQAVKTSLHEGDAVILHTDGATDARNSRDERFAAKRFLEAIGDTATGIAAMGESVVRAIHRHVAGHTAFDDMTLLCFGREVVAVDGQPPSQNALGSRGENC